MPQTADAARQSTASSSGSFRTFGSFTHSTFPLAALTTRVSEHSPLYKPSLQYMPAILEFLDYNPVPPGSGWAERLVQCRTALGLSQKESAKRMGVDQSTLVGNEANASRPEGSQRAGTTLPRLCGGNKCAALGLAPGRLTDCGLMALAFLRNRSDDMRCRDTDPAERRCKK
jgi:hypothetical protein